MLPIKVTTLFANSMINASLSLIVAGSGGNAATCLGCQLVEEIILIIHGREVVLSSGLASEGFAVADLLKVVQTAGDSLVPVAVESVQVDGSPAVHAGIDFGAFKDRVPVSIHDSGSRCTVGVDEVGVLVSLIIRSFQIAVAERCLDGGECRDGLAVALKLALAFLIGGFDGGLDLCDGSGVGLRDDKGDAVLRRSSVDALRIPDIGIGPSGIGSGDNFGRDRYFVCHDFFLLILR